MDEKHTFIECGCTVEVLRCTRWDDGDEVWIEYFKQGIWGPSRRWRDRLRDAWNDLHGRPGFGEVVLDVDSQDALAHFLLDHDLTPCSTDAAR